MRRTEWRRRADDPKTALGWWWREVNERDRWGWPRLGFVLLFVVAACEGLSGHSLFTWLFLIGTFVFGGLPPRRDPRRLRALLLDPPPVDTFAVEVTIRQGRVVTGVDVAAASFVEGFLHVEGYHASFALRANDVRWVPSGLDEDRVRLQLVGGRRVDLVPVDRRREFRAAVRTWSETPSGNGVSTLPPARVHPREFARWSAWFFFGLLSMGAWSFVAPRFHTITGYLLVQSLGVLVSLALGVVIVHRYWSLHRIDRDAKQETESVREALVDSAPVIRSTTVPNDSIEEMRVRR